jgi:hypothetical protein
MRIVTSGLLMAVFRFFTKFFYIRHSVNAQNITSHLRGTVPIYKTVLEALMEFVKLWQSSTIYKGFQLFGGVMLHCCVSGFSHFKGWWMGHVPLKCLEAPNDTSLARKTEVFDYISVMAWKFKPYVNFQVFGVVDCQFCLLGCDLLFYRWKDGAEEYAVAILCFQRQHPSLTQCQSCSNLWPLKTEAACFCATLLFITHCHVTSGTQSFGWLIWCQCTSIWLVNMKQVRPPFWCAKCVTVSRYK